MIIGAFAIAAILAGPSQPVRQPGRRGYLQASGLASYHPAASNGYHRESPNLRGTAAGLSVSAGGFLSPSIGLEGELLYGGTVSAPQRFSYFSTEDYTAGVRDLLFIEAIRYRPGGRSHVEMVAGGGYALTTVSETSIEGRSGIPVTVTHPADRSRRLHGVALTGGVDGTVAITPRVSFAPGIRFQWINRPDAVSGESHGIARYAIQVGAGIRFW